MLSEYQPKFNSARAVYKERKKYIDEIDWNMLATPPTGSLKACLHWLLFSCTTKTLQRFLMMMKNVFSNFSRKKNSPLPMMMLLYFYCRNISKFHLIRRRESDLT